MGGGRAASRTLFHAGARGGGAPADAPRRYDPRVDPPRIPGPHMLVHTGAWNVPEPEREAHRTGALRALEQGWRVLLQTGAAVDAVIEAVAAMEDDEALNAGVGAVLCREGHVELDAAVMRGKDLAVGAVACVSDVANPVRVAALLLDEDEVLLAGAGASRFARSRGVPTVRPESLILGRERTRLARWRERHPADTVGAVAVDAEGSVAAASSTGGRPGKPSGRIGDAPIPGAGLFADDHLGAVVATGWGEDLLRTTLARRAAELGRDHAARDACWMALKEAQERLGLHGGLLMLARDGSSGWAFNTECMAVALMAGDMDEPLVT